MRKEKYIVERGRGKGLSFEVDIQRTRNHKRKRYSKSFYVRDYATPSECLKAAIKHRDEVLRSYTDAPISAPTLKKVYQEKKALLIRSRETDRKYDLYFNLICKPLENRPIDKITPADITISLNHIIDRSDDVIKRCFTLWKDIFKTALIKGYVISDPTIKVLVPTSEKIVYHRSVRMTCSLEEVINALRNYGTTEESLFNGRIISYAVEMMYYLGLRPSECFALTQSDFDLDNMTLSINKAVGSTQNEKGVLKKAKNSISVRTLPLPSFPFLKEILKRDLVFADYKGKLMTSNFYTNFVNHASKKAHIDFRLYMLRHNFSTQLVTNKVDLRTIQELMGHKNSSMTLSYARSDDDKKKKAIDGFFDG